MTDSKGNWATDETQCDINKVIVKTGKEKKHNMYKMEQCGQQLRVFWARGWVFCEGFKYKYIRF